MEITTHADTRLNQRGIKKAYLNLALEHGAPEGDKIILSAKDACSRANELRSEAKELDAVATKGGITAVMCNGTLVTAYRTDSFSVSAAKKVRS
ncbi:hypothetical protein [Jannaschia sp. W003]|uniref:hypothetical protein n=1 Tax=Jannaschia sp. W003 TaxID=2867012 RepID=UPI0021A2F50C|nr:hypothetical protein [Jannaschia sp. W003]UWQ20119.1 hypothetical protein K3554_08865 [Jannaschia sp. W003]